MIRPLLLVCAAIGLGISPASAQTPVAWTIALPPDAHVDAGQSFDVSITAEVSRGWYIYGLEQTAGGPYPLSIEIAKEGPFSLGGPIQAPAPQTKFDEGFKMNVRIHRDRATFRIPVRVAAGAATGTHEVRVLVTYQTCNDNVCLPAAEVPLTVTVGIGGAGGAVAAGSTPPPVSSSRPSSPARPSRVPDLAQSSSASTFGAYLGLAIAMGALSLLTPCVFPMVPITVSYFTGRRSTTTPGLKTGGSISTNGGAGLQAGAGVDALVYGAGIVLTFTLVGVVLAVAFGASGLNRFAANPWLNLAIAGLFVMFALSLFGVYELAMPSSWLTAASKWDQGRARHAGTLLMALAFTLTSFTCTAPFLGTLLVVAAQGDWQWPLAGMLAFSAVFALPFVVLAMAPRLLASLPRSGVWLIAVKAVMGLLELAAAMKFISNVDLVWGWGIFTREVVLVIWIAIGVWLAGYLAGLVPVGQVRMRRPGLARALATAVAIAIPIWLVTGLGGRRLGELEAFLPPADLAAKTPEGELPWILNDYDRALAQAAREHRPILIDFTGYTCTNCRWMEANMFPRPEVERELARFVRVRLYTDGRGEMYRRFQNMERDIFGTVALPYYAVLSPDGEPRVGFGGLTRNPAEFIAFLQQGWK